MIPMTDLRWAALCAASESTAPLEQRYILGVIFNRWRTSYRNAGTLAGVVLEPKQFSHFNVWLAFPVKSFEGILTGWNKNRQVTRSLVAEFWPALDLAVEQVNDRGNLELLDDPRASWNVGPMILSPTTRHFYAPRSMRPAGSRPAWAGTAKRLWTPEGVDPDRLVLAEGVA